MIDIPKNSSNGLNLVDLFCGAGVGAYGFKRSGFNILWGVDNDPDAVRTYNINIGNHAICKDIRTVNRCDIPVEDVDVLVATPVCKPFSVSGARRLTNDEKYGDLLAETIRVFQECKPKALFFENVFGIVIGESLPTFLDFVSLIEGSGYVTYWNVRDVWELGVPQKRERLFLVAIRDDIPYEFIPPKAMLFGRTTQRDAIWDLRDKTIDDVPNHNADNRSHYKFRVNVRQTPWEEPSLTVMSHRDSVLLYPEPTVPFPDNDYVNRYEFAVNNNIRHMSVREHLRLQTVGDDFYFPSDISLGEQYNRCSGVPSLVAYKYGVAIANCLLGNTPVRKSTHKKVPLF